MREWCGCGAAIRASRRDVLKWRADHRCPTRPDQPGNTHVSGGAMVEHAGTRWFDGETPIPQAGFRPNEER